MNYFSPVTDRHSLLKLLNSACNKTYSKLRQDLTLEFEQNLVKTYIIEAHPLGEGKDYERYKQFIDASINNIGIYTQSTEDPSLIIASSGKSRLYIDIYDPRFWLIHTIIRSEQSDRIIGKIIRNTPLLDFPWLPTQTLEKLARLGLFVGFGTDFDSVPAQNIRSHSKPIIGQSLSFRFRKAYGTVMDDYYKLKSPEMYKNCLRLSTIRLRYGDTESEDNYCLDEITYWGKLTARGPSFDNHNALVINLVKDYRNQIKTIEKTCFFSSELEDIGYRLHGHPISIKYKAQENLDILVGALFSTTEPFRLWGIPKRVSNKLYSIHAIDLHTGSTINFEITNQFLRAYMQKDSCGNTIARLYTNIQRHIDSEAEIILGSGDKVFESAS